MSLQFIRKFGLFVDLGNKQVMDLSQYRTKFNVTAADVLSPTAAMVRVYNLDPNTIQQILQQEFVNVSLNAGYETPDKSNYAQIFYGSVKQFRIGRESNTDTYLDLLCADGDLLNYETVKQSLNAGSTPEQHVAVAAKALGLDVEINLPQNDTGGTLPNPRGKVMWGMATDFLRDTAQRLKASVSVQGGKLIITSMATYRPGDIVQLSELTGIVGIPEATDEGIKIQCLLNPRIIVGGRVQIANQLINQLVQQNPSNAPIPFNQWTGLQFYAVVSTDGLYRVWVVEHDGDTRGVPWYSHLTALAMSPSANPMNAMVLQEAQ